MRGRPQRCGADVLCWTLANHIKAAERDMANVDPTPTTIEQYREAKSQYLKLKNQARKELVARFNALAGELLQVQRELLEDFGEKVVLPSKSAAQKRAEACGGVLGRRSCRRRATSRRQCQGRFADEATRQAEEEAGGVQGGWQASQGD